MELTASNFALVALAESHILPQLKERRAGVEDIIGVVERAWWEYQDNMRKVDPGLPSFRFRPFIQAVFEACPKLNVLVVHIDMMFTRFKARNDSMPVNGAILLDAAMRKVLLVKGLSNRWGFPRGKRNTHEEQVACAVREVLEETGCDISARIKDSDHIETQVYGKSVRLYIVAGLDPNVEYTPTCHGEILACAWFDLKDLPRNEQQGTAANTVFFGVWLFMEPLTKWVRKQKKRAKGRGLDQTSCGDWEC